VAVDLLAVLEHTRDLQRATTVQDLLEATRRAVEAAAGYSNVWLCVLEPGRPGMVRVLGVAGAMESTIWEKAPRFPIAGDAMLEEILAATRPVVVEDARTDPRTDKAMVQLLGNRTIVNVPLLLGETALGAMGAGTFGDEGVRPPSQRELEHLGVMATHVAAALQRVRMLEDHRRAEGEREQLRKRMINVQRIEALALLAGGVAHDFNNMLTVIANNVRFAMETQDRAPPRAGDDPAAASGVRADLETALAAVDKGAALTRQLLALGRQQNLHLEPVDLNQLISALVALLRRLMPESIMVDLIPAARLPTVQADPTQLDQVLMNLCLNARDAMPGGGRLTIETEQVVVNGQYVAAHPWAKQGRYVLVTVTDTGQGMTPDIQERVFEPFFTTKAHGAGTGLGLAVAAGIVEQHGGMIHCYSEVAVGTTFKVYLPVHDRSAGAVGSKLEGQVPGGRERILLAEDDPLVLRVAQRILTRAGYTVVAVTDGAEAAAAALAEPFDLVLLDAVMPVASGREAYERIRAVRPDTAFLFASGHSRDVLPAEMLTTADVELVDKPYHPDQLLRAVRRALDRNKR
jgi:two-component system, cell cycle sensor histidine kinase and response regulator CckA